MEDRVSCSLALLLLPEKEEDPVEDSVFLSLTLKLLPEKEEDPVEDRVFRNLALLLLNQTWTRASDSFVLQLRRLKLCCDNALLLIYSV